jgi:cation transport ATPase
MLNDTHPAPARVATLIALDGRTEADLLALVGGAMELARLERLDESIAAGVSGRLNGQPVALGNAAYFAALGVSVQRLCDWPDRIRTHGQHVLFVAVDGRIAGILGITGN